MRLRNKFLSLCLAALIGLAPVAQAADISTWSTTAASNNTASPDGWPESMAAAGVNDSAREMMSALAEWYEDTQCTITSAGTGSAYTVAATQTISAYAAGQLFCFIAHADSGASATLNVDSVGAKTIKKKHDQDLAAADIEQDQLVLVAYKATEDVFQMLSQVASSELTTNLTAIDGLAVTDGNFIVGNGSTWVAESAATARTSLGLGSIATQASNSVSITGGSVTGITDVTVGDGGTGASTLTDGGLLLGSGTGAITPMAVLADGAIVVGDGTTDPVALAAFESSTGDLAVTAGGTGVGTLTDGGVLLGSGTADVTAMAVLADGEIIVGDGTTDPVAESGATARTSLGLAIGTDVQAFDAQLSDVAGLVETKGDIIVNTGSAWTDLAVGTNDQILTADSAEASGVKWADAPGIDVLVYEDQKTDGTTGGTPTTAAWTTRVVNTEVSDVGGHGSVATNAITLAAGTYEIDALSAFYATAGTRLRWRNTTDSTTPVLGMSAEVGATNTSQGQFHVPLRGVFTIASSKTFELQYFVASAAGAGVGLGADDAQTLGVEVYTVIILRKIS